MGRSKIVGRFFIAAPLVAMLLAQGCSSQGSGSDGANGRGGDRSTSAEAREQQAAGRRVARGMMGLPETPHDPKSEAGRATARYEAIATHLLEILEERDPGALERYGRELASQDEERVQKAWPELRDEIHRIAMSDELKDAVREDPAFEGVTFRSLSPGGVRPLEISDDGVPSIGRGPDGKFGDGREGAGAAAADTLDGFVDPFTPWRTLGKIDRGELVPDPESRLGAYAATAGYPPGSVGEAVHNAIGAIYIALGNYGEERIGRVFNSPEARALYNQPVDSPAGALMAAIEERYWQNVRAEDPWSPGGQLGSAFSPAVRDFLQRNIFSTGTFDGGTGGDGGSELSKTDCGDKSDGWWCLDNGVGVGWMVYCSGKQIAGGCGCDGCTTAGVAAPCSSPPPPAACE